MVALSVYCLHNKGNAGYVCCFYQNPIKFNPNSFEMEIRMTIGLFDFVFGAKIGQKNTNAPKNTDDKHYII